MAVIQIVVDLKLGKIMMEPSKGTYNVVPKS